MDSEEVVHQNSAVIDLIEKNIDMNSSVLDIGCAYGGILAALRRKGYCDLHGIEPSNVNCRYANDVMNLDVAQGTLSDAQKIYGRKKFDLVILTGVLEHLIDVKGSIMMCKALLKEDGYILLHVPDLDLFCKHQDLYQEFSIEHINYLSIH